MMHRTHDQKVQFLRGETKIH